MFAAACESSQPSTQLLLELPSLFLLSSKHGYVTFAYGEDWYWFFFFFLILAAENFVTYFKMKIRLYLQ